MLLDCVTSVERFVIAWITLICTIWFIISLVEATSSMLWFWNVATISARKSVISRSLPAFALVLCLTSVAVFDAPTDM